MKWRSGINVCKNEKILSRNNCQFVVVVAVMCVCECLCAIEIPYEIRTLNDVGGVGGGNDSNTIIISSFGRGASS